MPPSDKQTLEIPSGMYSMGRLNVRAGMIPASSPGTTLGFEAAPAASHQQRFLQSSASPNEVAPPSQHDQQMHPRYLAHTAQQSNSNGLTNRSNQEDVDMNERHAQKDQQFLKTFLEETMREVVSAVGLLRYNSAPSSVLAGLVGMGNDYLSQETGLTHVFPEDSVCTSAQIASKQDSPEIKGIHPPLNSARAGTRVMDRNVKVSGSDAEPEHSRLHSQHSHVDQNVNSLENGNSQSLVEGHGEDMNMANVSFSAPLTHGISEPSINASILHTGASNSVPTLPLSNSFCVGGLASQRSDEFVTSARLRVPSPSKGVGNLLRHSSSPAGLLSHLNDSFLDYEKVPLPCSSGNSSEEGSYERRELMANCVLGEGCSAAENAMGGSPTGASLAARKRIRELENKLLQREAPEHGLLSNHFGLPMATSAENLYPTDKLSPDSTVPCRARAKRGCATHPRSIAERVRRTKISERMKRLQELVPNMDKQTNTADMLDEAVEYVKFLQRQVQELKENQSKCQCSHREKESSE